MTIVTLIARAYLGGERDLGESGGKPPHSKGAQALWSAGACSRFRIVHRPAVLQRGQK
jgi:hypothetical protein